MIYQKTYLCLTANARKYCCCVARGDRSKVVIDFFNSFDILISHVAIPELLRAYQITNVIYTPYAESIYFNAKKQTDLRINAAIQKEDLIKSITPRVQLIQSAYHQHQIKFISDEIEKAFLRHLKSINLKELSIESESLLILLPYLLERNRGNESQVIPAGIYV